MIGVSGTQQGSETGATAAERYAFAEPDARSRVVIAIGLLIAGVVAYLRSTMPFLSPAQSEELAEEPAGEARAARPVARLESTRIDREDGTPREGDKHGVTPLEDELSLRSSGNVVPFPVFRHGLVDADFFAFDTDADNLPPRVEIPVGWLPPVAFVASPDLPDADAGDTVDIRDPVRRNRAPVSTGPVRLNEAVAGIAVLIGFSELLANAGDADGDRLSIGRVMVSTGSIGRTADGFVFSSNSAAPAAEVVVYYEITDGTNVIVQTARFDLLRNPQIIGTEGADLLVGTHDVDHIDGGAGDDMIDARGGDNIVFGGDGDDRIVTGSGRDQIFAGGGNDIVFAGAGNDLVLGGDGDDRLYGEAGDDVLSGDAGDDDVEGGAGNDLILGGDGDDTLDGGADNDTIQGGEGADAIVDGDGADVVFGDAGDDHVSATPDGADDYFSGGEGDDILDYSAAASGILFDLIGGTATSEESGRDRIEDFETIVGGQGADIYMVGATAVTLKGGNGADTFMFEVPTAASQMPRLVHDILDFVAGDRVLVAGYEFTMSRDDDDEDRFSRYYRDRDDDEDDDEPLTLRITHRREDGTDFTDFDFDYDGNLDFEMTVTLYGHHQPLVYETVHA